MTELFEHAVAALRHLPPEKQNGAAQLLMLYASDDQLPVVLTPAQEAAVLHSREAGLRGEFASDARMQAIWAKCL